MKKLTLIIIAFFALMACSKSELPDDPEPKPIIEPVKEINYIRYLKGPNPDSIFMLPKYTTVKFKAIYNITNDEISSYGFVVWQSVSSELNDKYWTITYKKELEKRADTLKFDTKLYDYFTYGDSAYMIIQLLRRKSEDTYSVLATDTAIFLIKPE